MSKTFKRELYEKVKELFDMWQNEEVGSLYYRLKKAEYDGKIRKGEYSNICFKFNCIHHGYFTTKTGYNRVKTSELLEYSILFKRALKEAEELLNNIEEKETPQYGNKLTKEEILKKAAEKEEGFYLNTDGIQSDLDGKNMYKYLQSLGFDVISFYDVGTNGIVYTGEGLSVSTNGYCYLNWI